MKTFLWAVSLSVVAVLGLGCPRSSCDASSCDGCCDANGECQAGNQVSACGASGAACHTCVTGQACNLGACTGGNATGGSGGTGGGSGSGGGGGAYTIETFCTSGLGQIQQKYVDCGYVTQDALSSLFQGGSCLGQAGASVMAGRATFNASLAQSCLATINAAGCFFDVGTECNNLIQGAVAAGGDCYTSDECQSGLSCNVAAGCPGSCEARVALGQTPQSGQSCVVGAYSYDHGPCRALVPAGMSCAPLGGSSTEQSCVATALCRNSVCVEGQSRDEGQTCDSSNQCFFLFQCVNGTCERLRALGQTCDTGRSCAYGLRCDATTGTCATRLAAGATCTTSQDCDSDLSCVRETGALTGTCETGLAGSRCVSSYDCDEGFFCPAPDGGTCTPKRTAGETCTSDNRYDACAAGLYCTATNTMMSGACAAKKSAGAACSENEYGGCADGLYCTGTFSSPDGVCATRLSPGSACSNGDECATYCSGSTCEPFTYCDVP